MSDMKESGKKSVTKKNESCHLKDKETSGDDTVETDGELKDSFGRVVETIGRSSQSKLTEPKVSLGVLPRGGQQYMDVSWIPVSAVFRTLIT